MIARTFTRMRDGRMRVRLHANEAALLRRLARDLREVVAGPSGDDAVTRRLFPRAYLDPTEEDAESQWQALVHSDLVAARLAALAALADALGSAPRGRGHTVEVFLDEEAEAQWLGVLNDARLAIGTALGVSDDPADAPRLERSDPAFALHEVYAWLTALEADLVDVLFAELPADGSD